MYVTNAYCDNRFNRKPKKGVNFLQEQGLLGAGAGEVAEWLHVDDRLDKTGIGDFLGENEDFTKEVFILSVHINTSVMDYHYSRTSVTRIS